jgi:hypothetical protein
MRAALETGPLASRRDERCDATHCSLADAVSAANANVGKDTIAFDIPGQAPYTISAPGSVYPTDPVDILGDTQPGLVGRPPGRRDRRGG